MIRKVLASAILCILAAIGVFCFGRWWGESEYLAFLIREGTLTGSVRLLAGA